MKNIYNCFKNYEVYRIDNSNIFDVFELCKNNKKYYEYLKEQPTIDGVKSIITELPPNTSLENKYFMGIYKDGQMVAILDLIDGYPAEDKAFIGLFMMNNNLQGRGIGKKIIIELLDFLKSKKYVSCELGVIETNVEAISFWSKLGFEKTGRVYTHEKYKVIMMNCRL